MCAPRASAIRNSFLGALTCRSATSRRILRWCRRIALCSFIVLEGIVLRWQRAFYNETSLPQSPKLPAGWQRGNPLSCRYSRRPSAKAPGCHSERSEESAFTQRRPKPGPHKRRTTKNETVFILLLNRARAPTPVPAWLLWVNPVLGRVLLPLDMPATHPAPHPLPPLSCFYPLR